MFLKSFKFLAASLIIIVLLTSFAEAERLSLQNVVKTAIDQNPDIVSARSAWQSAQAKIPQTLSLDDPRVGLEYEQIPSGSRNPEDGMKMYTAEQMIMFPGKIYAEWQMANKEAEMKRADYLAKSLEVKSEVKKAYLDLYFTERMLETVSEVAGFLQTMRRTAKAEYVVGGVTQADVLMANTEYLMMNNELITAQQEKTVKEAKLLALLGRKDEASIEADSELNLPAALEAQERIEKIALENRPELLSMKAEFEARDYAHLKSKMEFFPDIMLGAKKRVGDGWDAMISFSVPLYFWKQSYGVSSVGLEKLSAEMAYKNMQNMTIFEVKEAWVMAESSKRTTQLYKESIVPQNYQALKVALKAYPTGKINFQTLLMIERNYQEAKLKLYENQVNYGKALSELERLTNKEMM